MLKDNCELQTCMSADTAPSASGKTESCRSYWRLNQWQIRQYRHAIDENKWYMSERLGRAVAWEEAEYDFLHHGYYGCAPRWRKEYCSQHCSFFSDCKLGQLFARQ